MKVKRAFAGSHMAVAVVVAQDFRTSARTEELECALGISCPCSTQTALRIEKQEQSRRAGVPTDLAHLEAGQGPQRPGKVL